jgi:hypothetical protein
VRFEARVVDVDGAAPLGRRVEEPRRVAPGTLVVDGAGLARMRRARQVAAALAVVSSV